MLTQAQQAAKRDAADFARRELGDSHPESHFDRTGWQSCAEFGALGVTVPNEYGGRGKTLNEFVAMMEGLGSATRRTGLLFALNAQVFGAIEPIRHAGTAAQKEKYLPKLAGGDWVAAHGMTEPGGGSDPRALSTTAERTDSGWRINGSKHCITCGAAADLHVVYARIADGQLGAFLIDPGTPGVECQPLPASGLTGCGLGRIAYKNVVVPEQNVLGRPGSGAMLFQGSIERERGCLWGFVLGVMQRQLEECVDYANGRRVGGRAIAGHQAVSHRIAEMKMRMETARLLLYHVTALKTRGRRAALEASMTKLFVGESFLQNSIDAVRIHGGNGYLQERGVEQFVRDSLGGVLFSGTSDIQRNVIAACAGLRT